MLSVSKHEGDKNAYLDLALRQAQDEVFKLSRQVAR